MGQFSLVHWLILLVIVLLFFGPKKLPDLGKSLGKAIRGFKDALNTEDAEATPIEAKPAEATTLLASKTEVRKNETQASVNSAEKQTGKQES